MCNSIKILLVSGQSTNYKGFITFIFYHTKSSKIIWVQPQPSVIPFFTLFNSQPMANFQERTTIPIVQHPLHLNSAPTYSTTQPHLAQKITSKRERRLPYKPTPSFTNPNTNLVVHFNKPNANHSTEHMITHSKSRALLTSNTLL